MSSLSDLFRNSAIALHLIPQGVHCLLEIGRSGRAEMNTGKRLHFLVLAVSLLSLGVFASSLQAQSTSTTQPKPDAPPPASDGWHIDVTPYLWFAGLNGTTGIQGHEARVDATPGDVLSYLNLGFMGTMEMRYNRVLIPVDFIWVKLTDKKALPFDEGAISAKAEFKETIFTPGFGYRIADTKRVKADALFGLRYWHMNSSLSLEPSQFGKPFSSTVDWVDGVAGGKIETLVAPRFSIAVGGDAGGGGARLDYQVFGVLGFRVAKKWVVQAGYRYIFVNYRPPSTFVYDAAQPGLIVGATWNAK